MVVLVKLLKSLHLLLPHHLLSRWVGRLAHSQKPWLKNFMISWVMDHFDVNMSEAVEESPLNYDSFNDFFTRPLKPELRPITRGKKSIASPCDGQLIQKGQITQGQLFQAKGMHYPLTELVGGEGPIEAFKHGHFFSIYLAPKDYHRIHMPLSGTLESTTYLTGSLFSVNPRYVDHIDRLFCRNERLVCLFNTDFGPMYVILVGACLVGGIHTQWSGQVTPCPNKIHAHRNWAHDRLVFKKGQEMGHFCYGSTVVVLLPETNITWSEPLSPASPLTMGQKIAEFKTAPSP